MATPTSNKPFQRLPNNSAPINYWLRIKPDLERFVFEGEEAITIEIKEESPRLVLNARELQVHCVHWKGTSTEPQTPSKWTYDEATEWFEVFFDPPLPPGVGTLHLTYTGILNDKMKGFYRSKCKPAAGGAEYYNGVTQFEATDARRAFLCWDEPAVKATFDIELVVPKEKVALSNMPVKHVVQESGASKTVKFERTPKMSTFIVAWIVGEFEYVENTTPDNVLCRVYTPPGKQEQGRFALRVAADVLPYYKKYFGIAYPLAKMDLVAVADFSFGAMENWGLLIFRETCLLIDELNSSASSRQSVALVVGHEVAHQWFGNLVTPEWWTHLWLKEGYASFIEYLCVDYLFPEYDIWSQFVAGSRRHAMELDALQNSHPIEVPVGHPSEIDSIFDEISYNKGAAVIRMLHAYIGDEKFREGMAVYLQRHKYANAVTEDLWKALEEASGQPVGAVMKTWTTQMGFPLIHVDVNVNGNKNLLTLSQEPFVLGGGDQDSVTTPKRRQWMVPTTISYSSLEGKVHEILLEKESMEIVLEGSDSEGLLVKVNPGLKGFYRVQYTSETLAAFTPVIKSKNLPALDRLGILDDLFALVEAGRAPVADLFNLLPAFVDETNHTVWACIAGIVERLDSLIAADPRAEYQNRFQEFGRELFARIAGRLGWESVDVELADVDGLPAHLEALLRRLVLQTLTTLQDPAVLAEGVRRFKHGSGISADLRSVVYRAVFGSCNSDSETFARMLGLYRDADTAEEKSRIGAAMSGLQDPELIQRALQFAIGPDVRSQDTPDIIVAIAAAGTGGQGHDLAWNFFKSNRELFCERYAGQLYVGSHLVKGLCKGFTTLHQALAVEEFFKQHPLAGTERAVQQSLETIRLNAAWLGRIEEYFATN